MNTELDAVDTVEALDAALDHTLHLEGQAGVVLDEQGVTGGTGGRGDGQLRAPTRTLNWASL